MANYAWRTMCTPQQSIERPLLPGFIRRQAERYGERTALRYRDYERGEWQSVSWRQFAETVRLVSRALLALGIEEQEKLGVFSQNKPECLYCDFGAYAVKAVTIPFYATSSVSQVAYMMNDAEVRTIFVGEQLQYEILIQAAPHCQYLQRMVLFDSQIQRREHDGMSLSFEEFLELGRMHASADTEVERRSSEVRLEDMANILYTSGTTGQSKGVILTHGNYNAALWGHTTVLPVTEKDVVLNFLPFTHVFERGWSYYCLFQGCTLCVNLRPADAQQSMQEVHPTCMAAVPRFWEKVYQAVLSKAENSGPMQRKLILDAIRVGGEYWEKYQAKHRPAPLALRTRQALYARTVVPVLRKAIGIEYSTCFPTAGAAISPEVERFVHAAGIDMFAGYGLTETTATVSCDHPDKMVAKGSVGRALPGVNIRISAEGEIQVKGLTVTPGYYHKPEETTKVFTPDGWFRTGDAGYIEDGELFMTERIKDLFKTSNGKYIAPQFIEGRLTIDRYIEQAVIVADHRQFVSALIVPNYRLLEDYCRTQGIECPDRQSLCQSHEVHELLWERIQTLQQDLAHYEQIKRFAVLPRAFSLKEQELTNTLKIKRRVVYEHFAAEIEKLYK